MMKLCKSSAVVHAIFVIALASLFGTMWARSRGFPSICLQPPPRSEGICTLEIEGFYFDARSNDCLMYTVGGCRGQPGQSFGSRQDCLATCLHGTRRIQDLRVNE